MSADVPTANSPDVVGGGVIIVRWSPLHKAATVFRIFRMRFMTVNGFLNDKTAWLKFANPLRLLGFQYDTGGIYEKN